MFKDDPKKQRLDESGTAGTAIVGANLGELDQDRGLSICDSGAKDKKREKSWLDVGMSAVLNGTSDLSAASDEESTKDSFSKC